MVFLRSLRDAAVIAAILFFAALLLFGFQTIPFISNLAFTPYGFGAITVMFFLELVGLRW